MTAASKCRHGLDERWCAHCQRAAQPLTLKALKHDDRGEPVIVLHATATSATVLTLHEERPFVQRSSGSISDGSIWDDIRTVESFLRVAMRRGYLSFPKGALTAREQGEEGPTHCYNCHTVLCFRSGSLGCTECLQYAGTCLCGYTGRNYLGQLFSQFPALPISRGERMEFIRVMNLLLNVTRSRP
jgi:hypothetical protein